ncbi:Meiosis-specific protein HOP1 [Diplonema papillatum]|nr:Meiosis-specific protein HOP1 [Diplonema papillatum]
MTMQDGGTASAQESLVLVRNMMRLSVSTICYVRSLFPDNHFIDKKVAGIRIKALTEQSAESKLILQWLEEGVFQAIHQKYVKTVSFAVLSEGDEVLESYDFDIQYPPQSSENSNERRHGSASLSVSQGPGRDYSKQTLASNMKSLLHQLIEQTTKLAALPEVRTITMRLTFNSTAPAEYEPPFFAGVSKEMRERYRKAGLVFLNLGELHSKHHELQFSCRTGGVENSPMIVSTLSPGPACSVEEEVSPQLAEILEDVDHAPPHALLALRAFMFIGGAQDVSTSDLTKRFNVTPDGALAVLSQLREWRAIEEIPLAGGSRYSVVSRAAEYIANKAVDSEHFFPLLGSQEQNTMRKLLRQEATNEHREATPNCSNELVTSLLGCKRDASQMTVDSQPRSVLLGDEPRISSIQRPLKMRGEYPFNQAR